LAGYTLSDYAKSVTYAEEVKGTALFTLEGVKSTDGITVADKVVTLTAANLDGKNVTFNGGVAIILLRLAELVRRKRPAKALTAFPTSR